MATHGGRPTNVQREAIAPGEVLGALRGWWQLVGVVADIAGGAFAAQNAVDISGRGLKIVVIRVCGCWEDDSCRDRRRPDQRARRNFHDHLWSVMQEGLS